MPFPKRSKNQPVDIEDFYAVRIRALWLGFKQEHIAFWALSAYFFFEYVRPQSVYPVLQIIPWAQLTLLATLIAAYADKSVQWVENIENKFFLLFVFIIVLSGIFAFRPTDSLAGWSIIVNWVLVYFLVINIVNSEKRLFLFFLIYLIFSFRMSQHGFRSWAGRGFSFTGWGLIGAGGWFQNSGEFAIQMVIFSSLSGAFVMALKDKWGRYKKWFFYLMPFTGVMTVMGASSRGSQLALAAIGIVLLLRSKARLKVIVSLVIIVLFLFFVLPDEQMERIVNMGSDKNSLIRLAYWDYGMQVIRDHPLLGVGYKNWQGYAAFVMSQGVFDGRTQLPHNIFIEAGAELGLGGLFCFILMAVFVFVINARTRKIAAGSGNRFFYILSYGLDYGLVGYLVAGFFVTVLFYPFFWVQMAMTVALHTVTRKHASENKIPANTPGSKGKWKRYSR